MDLEHFGGRFSQANHAGHIGGVSLVEDAVVNEEEVAGFGNGLVGEVVDLPTAGTAGDDRSEGIAFDLLASSHFRKDDSLDAPLGHAGSDLRQNGIEDGFIDLLRLLHDGDLGRRFGLANGLDDRVRFDLMGREL